MQINENKTEYAVQILYFHNGEKGFAQEISVNESWERMRKVEKSNENLKIWKMIISAFMY